MRREGVFVEVGAYDGEYVSNTSGLADLGWTGYYIEPVPQYFRKCRKRHRRNQNITVTNLAIGDTQEIKHIYVGGPLSTLDPQMVELFQSLKWAKGHHKGKKVVVTQITLEDYLNDHGIKPGFELLSVDVEGYECNVFRTFDLSRWQPQMVVIELHDENDEYQQIRERCIKLRDYFKDHGYQRIYKDKSNSIFTCPTKPDASLQSS